MAVRKWILLLLMVLSLCGRGTAQWQGEYAADRLIVKLRSLSAPLEAALDRGERPEATGIRSLDRIGRRWGVRRSRSLFPRKRPPGRIDRVGLSRILVLEVPEGTDIPALCREYAKDRNVEYAEPDYVAYGGATTPDDTSFNQQWGMNNTGQTGGTADADIDAPEAWDWQTGDSEVVVAVVDSGCDFDHPDLAGKYWWNSGETYGNGVDDDGNGYEDDYWGWNFVYDTGHPSDDHGHGTHVAGIAAAISDNSTGVAGVSWGSRIMAVKVLNSGNWGYWSWIENGMVYAVDNGARAINLSIGGTSPSATLEDTVNYVYANGGILCVCTHNDGGAIRYPARYDNVIAVGSTDHNDARASSSNYGSQLDVVAPGASVYSTLWNDTYATWSGTSMATPHVTGTVALLLSIRSDLTFERVKEVLESTAEDQVGNPSEDTAGWDQYMGWGRINAYDALFALEEDADGMPDAWEDFYGLDPTTDDSGDDEEGDGLSNGDEYSSGSDPTEEDSDGDTLLDGEEVNGYGTDPTDTDSDEDGTEDGDEVTVGTDPADPLSAPDGPDVNDDGSVDSDDLNLLTGHWGTDFAPVDLDVNGDVEALDLGILLSGWTG